MNLLKGILGDIGSILKPLLATFSEYCRQEYENALEQEYSGLNWLHQTKKAQGDGKATDAN